MRKEINIVWLEDSLNSSGHIDRKEIVEDILKKKGYESHILEKQKLEEAKIELEKNKRIDFFITDYNIGSNYTGLSFLKAIREKGSYKQFIILYSNNEHYVIKNDIKNMLDNEKIDIFSNFTFFSLGDNRDQYYFSSAIDIILCRWDELNAIRGRYMCENAEIEYLLRKKLNESESNTDYKTLVKRLKNNLSPSIKLKNKKFFNNWFEMIDKRNSLAHTVEGYDNTEGFFIKSLIDENFIIYEKKLDIERKKLIEIKNEIIKFLNDYRVKFF